MYYRARHYSPRLGRFAQKDAKYTISDHYVYASNNPVRYVDPLGLDPRKVSLNLTQNLDELRKELRTAIDAIHRADPTAITTEVAERQYSAALDRLVTRIEQDVHEAAMKLRRASNDALDITANIQFGSERIEHGEGAGALKFRLRQHLENTFAREHAEYIKDVERSIEEDRRIAEQKQKSDKAIQATYTGANAQKAMIRQVLIPVLVAGAVSWFGGEVLGALGASGAAESTGGKYLSENWHKATFPNKLKSIEYHLAQHGKGRTAVQYTKDAMDFFSKNKNLGQKVVLKDGTLGIKIQTKMVLPDGTTTNVGGYWTTEGKLVTFWD